MRNVFSLALLLFGLESGVLHAQDSAQISKLRKKNLVYYSVGLGCNPFLQDKAATYGFHIVCVGCISRLRYTIHNRRVVRKINRIYGDQWFQENIRKNP